jgi:hypothetical protein
MGIDLKRLYYGATAFLVFLVAFFAAQSFTDQALRWIVVSNVPMQERYPMEVLPPPVLTPPATVAVVAAPGQPTPVPQPTLLPEQREAIQQKERARMEDSELRSAKEGIASSLAILLVALPIWFFHWRRWRTLTETESAQLFRLYVYALMLITLITAVVRGAGVVGAIVKSLLGAVDFSSRYASLTLAQDLAGGLLGALVALLAWWYHSAMVRAEPGDG